MAQAFAIQLGSEQAETHLLMVLLRVVLAAQVEQMPAVWQIRQLVMLHKMQVKLGVK
jgi:hypothetical protein